MVTLTRLGTLLNRATDLRAAVEETLPLVLRVIGSSTGWMMLRQGESFELVAAAGLPPGLVAEDHRLLRWSQCRCQRLAASGDLATTAEIIGCERLARIREQARDADEAELLTGGLRWHLSIPLRSPTGNIVGRLNVARRDSSPLDAATTLFLDLVGEFLASAIERAALTAELRRLRSEERERATTLAQMLVGRERLTDVAESIFSVLQPILGSDALGLLVVDPSGRFLVLRAARGWAADWVGRLWLPVQPPTHNGPAWALHVARPFTIRLDQLTCPFHVPPPVVQAGVRMSAFFPLFADQRPVGVLVANSFRLVDLTEE
ncbi:MAG: GAF domain-containing protein, partial [Thermomicrobium sp.]|nr:GAF domain-containing protein [Thermomicrobium sp.]